MSGKAKFVHWVDSPFANDPVDPIQSEPMFNVISNDRGINNGSTVTGESLLEIYGIAVPLFPDLKTWKREVENKRRCKHCWKVIRNLADGENHFIFHHGYGKQRAAEAV